MNDGLPAPRLLAGIGGADTVRRTTNDDDDDGDMADMTIMGDDTLVVRTSGCERRRRRRRCAWMGSQGRDRRWVGKVSTYVDLRIEGE